MHTNNPNCKHTHSAGLQVSWEAWGDPIHTEWRAEIQHLSGNSGFGAFLILALREGLDIVLEVLFKTFRVTIFAFLFSTDSLLSCCYQLLVCLDLEIDYLKLGFVPHDLQ